MYKTIRQLFGIEPSPDYARLLKEGAVILDVRSQEEFNEAHIEGALNIPIEKLRDNLNRLARQITIIVCCKDGSKSWYAKNLLDAHGYQPVINAGSWMKLKRKLEQR